ncbi:PH domain-containing protein [Halobacterium bonnevillei]|uniref:PH domain-containing protein n=1 Tax=Halobacterium bonnevillei TaxID=2692200 RepID=A0A6B0SCH0_9EURY|nr:PH domain-containing protein [Halobacterium bonnevillei]MXR19364.1 PH domain-containing protein [Halobacterium bonnevillei]
MERLDSRVRFIWLLRSLVGSLVAGVVVTFAVGAVDRVAVTPVVAGGAVFVVLLAVGALHVFLRYRAWRFEVRDDTLYIERGVLVNVRTVVPYVRVQHVDARRGPIERLLGLGSVVVFTAGSRGADVSIPGLVAQRADDVQETLRRLAIESEPESGDAGDAV